jgi:hypothetical protein
MSEVQPSSKMDKVSGVVGIMGRFISRVLLMIVGKMTGNEVKVSEGKEKVHGPATGRGHEGDTTHPDHPGITYTKNGAMKQINMQRPPPPSEDIPVTDDILQYPSQGTIIQCPAPPSHLNTVTDDIQHHSRNDHPGISFTESGAMKQTCFKPPQHHHKESKWTADTEGTYDFGNNFDTHPHENYAGPNLTKTIAPPKDDDDDLAIVQEKQGQEERYDLLHGGFPTGAPSPGLRGRGPEVVDKFDK